MICRMCVCVVLRTIIRRDCAPSKNVIFPSTTNLASFCSFNTIYLSIRHVFFLVECIYMERKRVDRSIKDFRRKGEGERVSNKIDVVCEIILFKVIERECQENKSESVYDDGEKTR